MRRLYVGNFDFEHELADARYQPPAKLGRLNADLATSWLAIAEDGDYLWCPEMIDPAFFALAAAQGLPQVVPVSHWADVPAGVELTPWGWTERLAALAKTRGWNSAVPPIPLVRELNSRQFSFSLETEWRCGLPGATAITRFDQLEAALRLAQEFSARMVIKANWGMSARERIFLTDRVSAADEAWIRKRLAQQGAVIIEPWVERIEEVGLQIDIPQHDAPRLVGITPLVCNDAGQYQGSWFTEPPNPGSDFHERWQPAAETALCAAQSMQDRGYFGPLGVDTIRYRSPDGTIQLRPLQDINARWTMGRLSLGWRKLLFSETSGFWRHFTVNDPSPSQFPGDSSGREIQVSPHQIGNRPVEHRSAVIFGSPILDH